MLRHLLLAATFTTPAALSAQGTPLSVGSVAPDFTLSAATQKGVAAAPLSLSSLRGQTVVLAFFPRARTSGCTVQMDAYRDQYERLFGEGKVTLLAISVDADTTLASWAGERDYPFTFLSDAGGKVGTAYGAYNAEKNYERRILYVVGPDGKITYVAAPFQEVDPTAYTKLGAALAKAGT